MSGMKILVIASQKGGAGKSTISANIAVAADAQGWPVVLMDTDPQGSLTGWWNVREADSPALAAATLQELPDKLDALRNAGVQLVVIDTPPSATQAIAEVVAHADLVLIPVRPSPNDLRAVGQTVDIVRVAGKPFLFCVTQAKATAKLTAQAVAALSAHGEVAPALLGDRVDFASSMIDGRTVIETDPRGRSAAEINALWKLVKDRFNESTKTRKVKKAI